MIGSHTLPPNGWYGQHQHPFLPPAAESASSRFDLRDGRMLVTVNTPRGRETYEVGTTVTVSDDVQVSDVVGDVGLSRWLPFMTPEWPDHSISQLRAAIAARTEAIHTGGSPDLALFGRIALGLNRSERWTEALSSALLGDWVAPLYDGTGLGRPALDRLRSEARRIHTQLVPLWQRRPGKNRVLPLEMPVRNGATLRDLLADRSLPDDPVLDQVPGDDPRLAAILDALNPADRAVVLALGHSGVATWADAAALTGSERPDKDGDRVRRTVRRAAAELRRRDGQRTDGPTGMWTPAQDGGFQ
ncbi:hypothetical protein [Streptomyces subrutilus]|uniref:hypothetical protein n=1 Tax=Streptomyces subrutilus TaxID=36818 RepID=UPI002E12F3CC|nr:hypothetical protein OG479_34475 [Streptomyces subrutilus]